MTRPQTGRLRARQGAHPIWLKTLPLPITPRKRSGRFAKANERHGLHVKVVEGGCSGFEYEMGIAAEDQVFEKNDARVLLDPQSFLHLNGTELDYKDELGCGQKI